MKIVDLSINIENAKQYESQFEAAQIRYVKHTDEASINGMINVFKGSSKDDFGEYGWAVERVILNTQLGTHMNSPFFYNQQQNETIDYFPIDCGFGKAIKLDFSGQNSRMVIKKEDIIKKIEKEGLTISKNDIVLLDVGADYYNTYEECINNTPTIMFECVQVLNELGVIVIGTNGFIRGTNDNTLDKRVYIIENMVNLSSLPKEGFKVHCLPQKIENASASWCRAVAFLDCE